MILAPDNEVIYNGRRCYHVDWRYNTNRKDVFRWHENGISGLIAISGLKLRAVSA